MLESGEAVKEALAIEAEAGEEMAAARAEQEGGRSGLSAGLLLQALAKERDSLDLFDRGLESLKDAVEERRRALDQQEQLLNDLVNELNEKNE